MHTPWFLIVSLLMFSASNRHPDLTVTLCARSLRLFRLPLVTLPNSIPICSLCCHPSTLFLSHSSVVHSWKVLAIHRRPTELDFKAVSLLLLAGDVALNPGPTTPLHDYTTSRLHHFTTTPLHDYTTSRLNHFTTTPLTDYTTSRLHHFTTTPLHDYTTSRLNHFTTTPLHDYTTSRLNHFTTTPLTDYTTSRLHHFTTTPLHDYTTSRLENWLN